MAATKYSPLALAIPCPLLRTNTSSSTTSSSSDKSLPVFSSEPEPEGTTIAYAIRKLSSTHSASTIGLFANLEEANNTVYKLRLEYETCDPCFFWYGDGHGSSSTVRDTECETTQDVERNEKGDCLSWEVFADDEEEPGCKVWVERVEVATGSPVSSPSCEKSWREALEPIARPCEFWGTFLVKDSKAKTPC